MNIAGRGEGRQGLREGILRGSEHQAELGISAARSQTPLQLKLARITAI